MERLVCRRCENLKVPIVRWHSGENVRHLGAYCADCGRWIKWLPQTPATARAAEQEATDAAGN